MVFAHSDERPRRARPSVRRLLAVAMVLLILTTLSVYALGRLNTEGVAAGGGPASLPDRIAGYSRLTPHVRDRPAGRAIALYRYGNNEMFPHDWQLLALGADRDSYRRVRNDTGPSGDQTLLAPDGQSAFVVEGQLLQRVDLATGGERSYRLAAGGYVRLLAISPDGARIAYVTGVLSRGHRPDPGVLTILELAAGTTSVVPGYSRVDAATFAPDSRRLAVHGVPEIAIVTLDGRRVGGVPTPPRSLLVSNAGWSPDGELLAVRSEEPQTSFRTTLTQFLSTTGAAPRPAPPSPDDIDETLLGWTANDRVLILRFAKDTHSTDGVIEEISLAGSPRRVIARFSTGNSCEYWLSNCWTQGVSLAQGLLLNLTHRSAGLPDRGPLPRNLRLAIVIGVELLAVGTWLLLRRRRTRRGMRRKSRFDRETHPIAPSTI